MERFIRSLWLIVFGLNSASTWAESRAAPQVARVAFTKFPPWCFKNDEGRFVGILVDSIRDLAKAANLSLKEEDIPIARLHHSIKQGKLDIFFVNQPDQPLTCCESLDKVFDGETIVVGRKKGPTWSPTNKGQAICRTGLSGYDVPGFQMFDADGLETCARMVVRERLPFLIGERYSLMKILQSQPPEIFQLYSEPSVVERKSFYLYITKTLDASPAGPLIRKAAQEMKFTDYIDRYAQ